MDEKLFPGMPINHVAKKRVASGIAPNCRLDMTAADLKRLGLPVPEKLKKSPGKNLADLMSDQDLEVRLLVDTGLVAGLARKASKGDIPEAIMQRFGVAMNNMRNNLNHLKEIGRLPEQFRNFDVDDFVRKARGTGGEA